MQRHKPPVSAWIVSERKRLGWKAEELSQRLIAAGYPAEVSTVRVWEAGRTPAADTIAGLEKLFGSTAPVEREPVSDNSELVAVLSEIRDELRLSRLVSERSAEVLAELLGTLGRPLLEETPAASAVRVESGAR